jgi:hypothetical protein
LREGEQPRPNHVSQIVKHGGGSIMTWGCMTALEPGAWYQIEGRMEQHLYKKIYKHICKVPYRVTT